MNRLATHAAFGSSDHSIPAMRTSLAGDFGSDTSTARLPIVVPSATESEHALERAGLMPDRSNRTTKEIIPRL